MTIKAITRRLFLGSAPVAAIASTPVAAAVVAPELPPSLIAAIRKWQTECAVGQHLRSIADGHKWGTPERDEAHLNWKVQYEVTQDALTALLKECARFGSA